jgi:hypothetical protein
MALPTQQTHILAAQYLWNLKGKLPHSAGARARLGCFKVSQGDAGLAAFSVCCRHDAAQSNHCRLATQSRQVCGNKAVGIISQVSHLHSSTSTATQGKAGSSACC